MARSMHERCCCSWGLTRRPIIELLHIGPWLKCGGLAQPGGTAWVQSVPFPHGGQAVPESGSNCSTRSSLGPAEKGSQTAEEGLCYLLELHIIFHWILLVLDFVYCTLSILIGQSPFERLKGRRPFQWVLRVDSRVCLDTKASPS